MNTHFRLLVMLVKWSLFFFWVLAFNIPIFSQTQPAKETPKPATFRVVTKPVAPFVISDTNPVSGFSIDLWKAIGDEMDIKTELIMKPTVTDLLKTVKAGEADLGIAAVSITAQREQDFDFSYPVFDSGLQILVPVGTTAQFSLKDTLASWVSVALLKILGVLALLIVFLGHIVWLVERRHPDGMVSPGYFPGILKALWWSAATLGAQADEMPKSAVGRVTALLTMYISIIFLVYFTANLTASQTVQNLKSSISGPDDLPGKRVATVAGSTSAMFLKNRKIQALEFPNVNDCFKTLADKKADAVVYDAPILLYYAAHEGKGRVQLVGSIFQNEAYGIVFPQNSPYRKEINLALLKVREKGIYLNLYQKWFGSIEGGDSGQEPPQ